MSSASAPARFEPRTRDAPQRQGGAQRVAGRRMRSRHPYAPTNRMAKIATSSAGWTPAPGAPARRRTFVPAERAQTSSHLSITARPTSSASAPPLDQTVRVEDDRGSGLENPSKLPSSGSPDRRPPGWCRPRHDRLRTPVRVQHQRRHVPGRGELDVTAGRVDDAVTQRCHFEGALLEHVPGSNERSRRWGTRHRRRTAQTRAGAGPSPRRRALHVRRRLRSRGRIARSTTAQRHTSTSHRRRPGRPGRTAHRA